MSQREGYIIAGLLLLVIIVFIAAFVFWQANSGSVAIMTQQAINQQLLNGTPVTR